MSENEYMVTDPTTGGVKGRKPARFELLPGDALAAVAVHYAKGSRKYEDRNWERGYAWSLSYGAMQRHLWAWWQGEDIDEESGTSHIVSAAWHALALVTYELRGAGTDDRPVQRPKRKRRRDAGQPRRSMRAAADEAVRVIKVDSGLALVAREQAECTYPDCGCVDPSTGCELRGTQPLPWQEAKA